MSVDVTELTPVLKKLRLSGVLQTLDLRMREAVDQDLGHAEFLLRLFGDEAQRRDGKQMELRLRRANFESAKRLEDFDWSFNPQVPRSRVVDLATCRFVERRENVLLIGPAGVGKSHLAQAIGERACRQGHSACYTTAHQMLSQLRAARADQTLERRMLRFTGPDLLVVDDLGLRPLEGDEPIDLYEVIRQRYERGAMVITSNRAVEEWPPLFLDDLMASAAMDRLLHHAHVVVMEGRSYRARGRESEGGGGGRTSGRQARRPASDEP